MQYYTIPDGYSQPKPVSTIDMFSVKGMSKLISEVTRDTHFHFKHSVEKRETHSNVHYLSKDLSSGHF